MPSIRYSREKTPPAIPEYKAEEKQPMTPRMTWRNRIRRLWGFIGRRRRVAQEDLKEMGDAHSYWEDRHKTIFSRLHYFERSPELDKDFAEDLGALMQKRTGHFETRLKELRGRGIEKKIKDEYNALVTQIRDLTGDEFRTAFKEDIKDPAKSEIIASIVRSGHPLTRWIAFTRTTEKIMDRYAPMVGEALLHVYENDQKTRDVIARLKNIYMLRAKLAHPAAAPTTHP